MSKLRGKKAHDIPTRRLPSLCIGLTLIWIEDVSSFSRERDETLDRLCASNNCHIIRYTNVSKCLKYLKQAKAYERIVIIMTIDHYSINTTDISGLIQYRQIQSIFIVPLIDGKDNAIGIDILDNIRVEIGKLCEIFHDYQSLFDRFQLLMNEVDQFDDDFFVFFNRPEKSLRDLRNELGQYIWSQSLRVVLKAMSYNSSEAKREMLAECRKCYYNDQYTLAIIDEFEHTYRSADVILWYTKSCFLYRLINRALRTEDNLIVYKFRYFIIDLCTRLEETALTSVIYTKTFQVYRGSKISRVEIEKLQVDSLIATNGFFSSSRHLDVAQQFIGIDSDTGMSPSHGRDDQCQYVLFEVHVDLMNSPDVIVSDVSDQSVVSDEKEILFNLGTTFIVTNINYDDKHHVWYIQMITSSEVASLNKEYNRYTLERTIETTPAISFGYLTCEILSNYSEALNHLHRLLRSKTFNDDNRPGVYYYLAHVYHSMGKYEEAITYCQWARLLLRRRLPQLNMAYARTLDCLGTIYLEMGNRARAIYFHEKASAIYHRTLPKNHYIFGFHFNNLAKLYWQNGQYESALELLTNTLTFVKKTLPPNYTCEAQSLHIIGLVQRSLNNREQAINYFKQSLQMRVSFQGNDHPYVARTCQELSELYAEQDDYSTALDYSQRSLCIRKAKLPRKHIELKQSLELVERLSQRKNAVSSSQ